MEFEKIDIAPTPSDSSEIEHAKRKIGIFVAWPYANGPRHIGHGAALVPADVKARFERANGNDVLMVSGTDEYGTPNMIAAEKKNMPTQEFVNMTSEIIRDDFIGLGMSYDWFTHTTSPNHQRVAQLFFANLADNEYISPGKMLGSFDAVSGQALPDRYIEGDCPVCHAPGARGDQCDNCTSLLEPNDLVNPISTLTGHKVEFKSTDHYFLNLDKLKDEVSDFLANNPNLRKEAKRMSENLVSELRPRAITRDLPWGVPLPKGYELDGDSQKVLYVWFEAVIGYLSASIEWAAEKQEPEAWKQWWSAGDATSNYFMGKDNVPFHTIIWPALLAAKNHDIREGEIELLQPGSIASTGNLNFGGDKFSTSRGNVAYIKDILQIIGPDALRYYLIAAGPENRDSNFTFDDLVNRTNTELVAKWGNLVSRTTNLIQRDFEGIVPTFDSSSLTNSDNELLSQANAAFETVGELIAKGKFSAALNANMELIAQANKYIVDEEPWSQQTIESGRHKNVLATLAVFIENATKLMCPFLPHSSQKISEAFGSTELIAPMPAAQTSSAGLGVLSGDYGNSFEWKFSNNWLGNSLPNGKTIVFAKLDLNNILQKFEEANKK